MICCLINEDDILFWNLFSSLWISLFPETITISTKTHGKLLRPFLFLSLLMKIPPFSTSLVKMIASICSSVADFPAGFVSSKISYSSWSPFNLLIKDLTFEPLVLKSSKRCANYFCFRSSSPVIPQRILFDTKRAAWLNRTLWPEWIWSKVPPRHIPWYFWKLSFLSS